MVFIDVIGVVNFNFFRFLTNAIMQSLKNLNTECRITDFHLHICSEIITF